MKLWCCHGLLLSTARPWNLCHWCWPQNITEAKTLYVFALFWHGISIFWSQPRLSWKWNAYVNGLARGNRWRRTGTKGNQIHKAQSSQEKSRSVMMCQSVSHLDSHSGIGWKQFSGSDHIHNLSQAVTSLGLSKWRQSPHAIPRLVELNEGLLRSAFFPPDSTIPKLLSWLKSPGGKSRRFVLKIEPKRATTAQAVSDRNCRGECADLERCFKLIVGSDFATRCCYVVRLGIPKNL